VRPAGWREALLVGLVATVFSLADRGFDGGRWWDVPGIKSFIDPRLYQRDPFVWTLHNGTPAAYPYQLIAAVARLLPFLSLDQTLFLLYVPVTVAALTLLYRIALRLVEDRAVALLFLVLYVVGFKLTTFGSTVIHSAETTPQTLALPLQLGAIYALLVHRFALAGLLMGLAFNLHTPSSVLIGAAISFYLLVSLRQVRFTRAAALFGLMVAAGSPAIVGALAHHGDQLPLWALNLARLDTASDVSFAVNFSTRALVEYNLLGLALIGVAMRAAPSTPGRKMVLCFFGAVGLMCLVTLLCFDLTLRTPITTMVTRLQLPRSAWLLDVFGLLYLTRYLVGLWRSIPSAREMVLLLLAAMLAAPPDPIPIDPLLLVGELLVLAGALVPALARTPFARAACYGLALGCGLAGLRNVQVKEFDFQLASHTAVAFAGPLLGCFLACRLWRYGWAPARAALPGVALGLLVVAGVHRFDDWRYAMAHRGGLQSAAEFQDWVRTSTPVDSVFLLLPSEPNNPGFYRRADRAVFLVRERANQALYFQEHNVEFERRVRALGVDQPLRYKEDLDAAYRRLTEDQVRQLARDFGVTHFVPARAGNYSFPIVYQQGAWTVYAVQP
jgi:hypothetical protein